ncbi:MAG TPA: protein kinase [Polyangium sp.]|nr:protein kinase [Polyangium sp.]
MERHIAHGHELTDTVVGGRFRVGSLTNVGGMGLVYEARDLTRDGMRVAFKVMPPVVRSTEEAHERFFREAEVLASLRHPGIVEYITHGTTPDLRPYLVMEWLEGEELEALLRRGPLPVPQAVLLLRRIAHALAFAHERGITHRDLKPANIILRDGRVDNPAIVDFGVARWLGRTLHMTRTGMLIGTPGYMAPEQARGQTDIGPSADVFALGCMFYQAIVGKPPFTGDHITAVLTKVLFEEVPPLRFHRPETPEPLDLLLSRMLLKDAAERPRDARAVLTEIEALAIDFDAVDPAVALAPKPSRKALTDTEQALYCLVLATPERAEVGDSWTLANSTIRTPFVSDDHWPQQTLEHLGVQLESLADGSLAIIVGRGASAKEQAATAVRCGWLLLERNPSAQVTLVTGRGVLGPRGGVPEGEVFERASALLRRRAIYGLTETGPNGIWIDDITARVLGSGYHIEQTPMALVLTRGSTDLGTGEISPLLSDSAGCVGREREVTQLLSILDGVVEDERCSAVVITASPGMGKTRLLRAFLSRVRNERPQVAMLQGHGDPSCSTQNYGLLASVIRELAGITPVDTPAEQKQKLAVRLGKNAPKTNGTSTWKSILDLCTSGETSAAVPAVWPVLENALQTWLAIECAVHPVLITIDDTHWVDASTLRFVDGLLRSATNLPVLVLTIQRDAGQQHTPLPWQGRAQELRLSGLSKRAAERFVRLALGNDTPLETIAKLVHDAAGSPLFLEELVRAAAAGHPSSTPQPLLAILQARMKHLSYGARRALRAASLFGQTFWRRGVAFLLGLDRATDEQTVGRWLDELLDADLLELHPESRFPGDTEYGFRSVHVREAANGLLTDADRNLGRMLVSVFLEQVGEDEAVLASATYEIVQYLQKRHNGYFIARLSMLTGIALHTFKKGTPDDPARLKKLRVALGKLLHDDEIAEVRHLFRDA